MTGPFRIAIAAAAVVGCALHATTGGSQDVPPPPPSFRVGVDAVRIDAVVTDKHGQAVTDLSPGEFELRQDGDLQVVTLAQYVRESAPVSRESEIAVAQSPARAGAPERDHVLSADHVQRTIAFVVDDLGLSWESLRDTRRAMHTFIDERVQPGDLVGILRTSTFGGAPQQFTTDKHWLHAIVDQVQYTAQARRGVSALPASPKSHGNSRGAEEMDAVIGSNASTPGPVEVHSALDTLSTLAMIVRGAQGLPGRKVVVLLSEGFRLDVGDNGQFIDSRLRERLERLFDQAARAGVVIYTLDTRGLLSGCETAEGGGSGGAGCPNIGLLLTTQNSLWMMAHETGGRAIENTNDLAAGLARVDEAERGYYVLGYTPAATTFAKPGKTARFHTISLRVKRPGLDVRVRSGFLGHPDAPQDVPKTPSEEMFVAATSPFVVTTIPVEATVLPAFTREDGNYLRVLLHVDLGTLTPTRDDGREVLQADVLALVFDEWGDESSRRADTLTVTPDSTRAGSTAGGAIVYSIKVPVPRGGGYQVRLAIRDRASGHLGSAGEFVEVQDAAHGDFALSGVLLAKEGKSQITGESATASAIAPSDPTHRTFVAGDRIVYTYEIYNPSEGLEVTPSIWRDGKRVFAAPADRIASTSKPDVPLKIAGGLQLTSLAPGGYVFQIEATAKARKVQSLIRQTAFQVQ